jgi:hypothetical protein
VRSRACDAFASHSSSIPLADHSQPYFVAKANSAAFSAGQLDLAIV